MKPLLPSWGMSLRTVSRLAFVFSVVSTIQGKTKAKPVEVS